jgi:hypothetical protein
MKIGTVVRGSHGPEKNLPPQHFRHLAFSPRYAPRLVTDDLPSPGDLKGERPWEGQLPPAQPQTRTSTSQYCRAGMTPSCVTELPVARGSGRSDPQHRGLAAQLKDKSGSDRCY